MVGCWPDVGPDPGQVLDMRMACGLPVICSDIAPHREIISHGVNGFLITLEDHRLAADSLSITVVNKESVDKVSENARNWVLENHKWEYVAQQYLGMFKKV